jgi:ATP-dependent RNA helicase DDX55/SPB4
MESQVQEITELPSNLINFFHVCEGQAQKLRVVMDFIGQLKSDGKEQKLIVFFATCASVDYHYVLLKHLLGETDNVLKLHGKIN